MNVTNSRDWFDDIDARMGGAPQIPDAPDLFVSAKSFKDKDVPPREWLISGLIPANTVTLLSGDGGTGKSLLALQLAMSVATGSWRWLDRQPDQGRALYIGAEDDLEEMHRRINDMIFARRITWDDIDDLKLASLADRDALLSILDPKTNVLYPSPLWSEIELAIKAHEPKVVILDTLADLYPGNENDRAQARQFIGQLRRVCVENRVTIVLLSHPSLSGMSSGSGTSGNTAWSNSVRSRLYMQRIIDGGYEADKSARKITVMKSNYGETGLELVMKYNDGAFEYEGQADSLDRMANDQKADTVYLRLLDQVTKVGMELSATGGANYAPTVFARQSDRDGVTRAQFLAAQDRLLVKGELEIYETGPASKRRKKIRRKVKL